MRRAGAAAELASSSQSMAQGASEQAASLDTTSAASVEIGATAKRNSGKAHSAADSIAQSHDKFEATNCSLGGAVDAMNEIYASSDKISRIVKTIDDDLGLTEVSIGHATAVDAATDALDHLQPTAASHSRVMVLEVMGRDAGHIALSAGIAGGADVILIPEISYSLAAIAAKIEALKAKGRNFALVVVAEAVKTEYGEPVVKDNPGGRAGYGGIGHYMAARIAGTTGADTRVTVLGHIQRGGQPDARDRIMASSFGVHAVDLMAEGRFDRMVAWREREVGDVPILEAIRNYKAVDPDGALARTARGLPTSSATCPYVRVCP